MQAKSARAKRKSPSRSRTPSSAQRVPGGLPCADCDFVAKHPLGLGRHRSSRHGATPKSAKAAPGVAGAWVSRSQAAAMAGVHYNTIRSWDQQGLLHPARKPGVRGTAVSVTELRKILADRAGGGGDGPSRAALQGIVIKALERILAQVQAASQA